VPIAVLIINVLAETGEVISGSSILICITVRVCWLIIRALILLLTNLTNCINLSASITSVVREKEIKRNTTFECLAAETFIAH
jgi:hypothetical protein